MANIAFPNTMNINKAILLLFLIFSFHFGRPQCADTVKYWSSSDKLKWCDFKGKVPIEVQPAVRAVCPHDIIVSPFREEGILNYKVEVFFLKHLAWSKDTSSYTLAHEQLHFDIAEVYARKLRKSIKETVARDGSEIDLKIIIEDLLVEEHKVQDDYDRETAHGIYRKHQLEWEKRIVRELELLRGYSSDLE